MQTFTLQFAGANFLRNILLADDGDRKERRDEVLNSEREKKEEVAGQQREEVAKEKDEEEMDKDLETK